MLSLILISAFFLTSHYTSQNTSAFKTSRYYPTDISPTNVKLFEKVFRQTRRSLLPPAMLTLSFKRTHNVV